MKYTDKVSELQSVCFSDHLLYQITNQIRRSLELGEILAVTVAEVRSFLGSDRVKIYKFAPDNSGEVIAEAIHEQRLPSLLGLHFPADDIPEYAREMFVRNGQRVIVDVSTEQIGLSPLQSLGSEDIFYRSVDPCHIQYLKAMGVQSSLVVPILDNNPQHEPALWGLLVSHHSEPQRILQPELKVVQQVADTVSIAIAQSNLLASVRDEQQREAVINRITTLLHSLPTIQVQAALEEAIAAFAGVGGRLYIEPSAEVHTFGEQPKLPYELENSVIEQHPVWQNWIVECKGNVWAIADLYKQPNLRVLATAFQSTGIRGLLVIPLRYRQNFIGCLSIFRKEIDTATLWAGRCDNNRRQTLPQLSFEVWREEKKGQAPEWKPEEISLAQALGNHFSMAIQQQLMYQQVQTLNLNLERRVEQQTAQLQKSLQLASVVKQITDQIRSTLDLKTILQTIVREIRNLLFTDRVLIYQIADNGGQVIVEDISENTYSLLGIKAPPECFPDEYARLYFRGRIRAINNVLSASLSPCHQEFLLSHQVRANLIVPINMGTQLWGLLVAHECHAPRNWQDGEIDLLQQLADQAAIAIGQAQLYLESRAAEKKATAQAAELAQALHNLKQTQTQLIQTEKMSSLGQLVAGVAHEINNPVNFIYGNLSHAINYTEDLLELLQLYQLQYPQPNAEIDLKAEAIDLEFLADDLPKIMSSMQVGADRIRSIVLSLRNFSRLDEAEMKAVDLHEGIDNTLLILQHRIKATSDTAIEILKDYGDLPVVECYAGQMNQVFMNIISNAIDALSEMGKLGISAAEPCIRIATTVSADNTRAVIIISNNGPGITEKVKKRIFDPFFTTKPVGKGTGLGLSISYQVVVGKHNGTIECVSQLDKGTEFKIEIPLKQTVK